MRHLLCLVILDRSATKQVLERKLQLPNPLCDFCRAMEVETRDHLFFGCKQTFEIGSNIQCKLVSFRSIGNWDQELHQIYLYGEASLFLFVFLNEQFIPISLLI